MSAPRDDKAGVKQTWKALTEAGYDVDVIDGAGERFKGLDKARAVEEVMSCDDGYFVAMLRGDQIGWVWFVFGNSPEEVISDYATTLEHVIAPLSKKWGW